MQGRLENEIKLQKATEKLLSTMPAFVNEWYINMKASRRAASSCRDYVGKIHKFLEYIDTDIKNVKPKDITLQTCESYMIACQTKNNDNGMEVFTSDSYQATIWCALNCLLKFLEKRNYIEYNHMNDIERPKNRDLERVNNERILLTPNDFRKILNAAQQEDAYRETRLTNRNTLIVLLFMTTGIRRTALAEINISDINLTEKTLVVVDKGNKTHIYTLTDEVIEYYNAWLKDRNKIVKNDSIDALFISRLGERISSKGISNIVEEICQRALGKRLTPHKLRSGFCSILYSKTHDVEFVRRAVGHTNIRTTQRYIKTEGKEKEKAVQIISDVLKI